MPISHDDPFVARLHQDIARLIDGNDADSTTIAERLRELALANNPALRGYWARMGEGFGIPDTAFRNGTLFHFRPSSLARSFRTSGTSGPNRGSAGYSPRGLDLMRRSIRANGRRHLFTTIERPAVIRLVPDSQGAPDSIMAYGMDVLARSFGEPTASGCVLGKDGLDMPALFRLLDRAVAEQRPVVLIGGSFAYVHLCDALAGLGRRWELPTGSVIADAGGFKGRSRVLHAEDLRFRLANQFGIGLRYVVNLFGMTELASQIYDSDPASVGPNGERAKAGTAFVRPRIREPLNWGIAQDGQGIVEIEDLCILDRPHVVLTGDWGVATTKGVAIVGRVVAAESRGCALAAEEMAAIGPTQTKGRLYDVAA